jgi:hypothetical protein
MEYAMLSRKNNESNGYPLQKRNNATDVVMMIKCFDEQANASCDPVFLTSHSPPIPANAK